VILFEIAHMQLCAVPQHTLIVHSKGYTKPPCRKTVLKHLNSSKLAVTHLKSVHTLIGQLLHNLGFGFPQGIKPLHSAHVSITV